MKTFLRFCLVLVLAGLWLQETRAQAPTTTQITTKGVGSILNNDVAAARDQAVDDALRNAVEQALGTLVQSQSLVQNFQLVEDNILSWARGYVTSYRVVQEGKGPYDTYEVSIAATVDMANLTNDQAGLQELLQKIGNPRLLILIDEANIDVTDRWYYFSVDITAAETAMIDILRQKGFEVVDPSTAKANQKRDQIMAALSGDNRMAAAIATQNGAEIVITGKAIAKIATGFNMGGMKSCQATVTARAVKADVASIIASTSEHAAYPHIDEITGGTMAIEKAARKVAETFADRISQQGHSEFYNYTTVKLMVSDFGTVGQLADFVNKLRFNIRGIKNVQQRNATEHYAELDVQITGNAQQLSRELEHKDLSPFTPRVVGMTMNKLTVKLGRTMTPAPDMQMQTPPDSTGGIR